MAADWQSVEPFLKLDGPYNENLPVNLVDHGFATLMGENGFSLMATVRMMETRPWARIFSFCTGPESEAIMAGAVDSSTTLHFTVTHAPGVLGSVDVPEGLALEKETVLLFTVSPIGHMRIFADGWLLNERPGLVPNAVDRPFVNFGCHHSYAGQGFCGDIRDIKMWSHEVAWYWDGAIVRQTDAAPVAPPPPPAEAVHAAVVSVEEPSYTAITPEPPAPIEPPAAPPAEDAPASAAAASDSATREESAAAIAPPPAPTTADLGPAAAVGDPTPAMVPEPEVLQTMPAPELPATEETLANAATQLVTKSEQIMKRCAAEQEKEYIWWTPIDNDLVLRMSEKRGKGMLYDLEFPWSAQELEKMGAAWLTKAFHAAGTLGKDNRVTKVTVDKKINVNHGNNGGKFLFTVEYAKSVGLNLHTKLFAKVPYPLKGDTQTDRLSSSVNKQPMEFFEINTYRLFEAAFPTHVPKYYYGDISNETSNFILIMEQVPYGDMAGLEVKATKGPPTKYKPRKPGEVEGPYTKCKDFQLAGPDRDYYMVIFTKFAMIAGQHKNGGFGSDDLLENNLNKLFLDPADYEAWGMSPDWSTGENPRTLKPKVDTAMKFFSITAKALFPDYVTKPQFQGKFRRTILKVSAYQQEINYWKFQDRLYVALTHGNLNIDNAYFWRDASGDLDCGILDFGGFGETSVPERMWWCLNCAQFENIRQNLDGFILTYCEVYKKFTGAEVDPAKMRKMLLISAIQNCMFMITAIPNTLRQCPAKEWVAIKDRHHPKIADNLGGKSTLRTTLSALENQLRIIEELDGDKLLDDWIKEVYTTEWECTPKTGSMINDPFDM